MLPLERLEEVLTNGKHHLLFRRVVVEGGKKYLSMYFSTDMESPVDTYKFVIPLLQCEIAEEGEPYDVVVARFK